MSYRQNVNIIIMHFTSDVKRKSFKSKLPNISMNLSIPKGG